MTMCIRQCVLLVGCISSSVEVSLLCKACHIVMQQSCLPVCCLVKQLMIDVSQLLHVIAHLMKEGCALQVSHETADAQTNGWKKPSSEAHPKSPSSTSKPARPSSTPELTPSPRAGPSSSPAVPREKSVTTSPKASASSAQAESAPPAVEAEAKAGSVTHGPASADGTVSPSRPGGVAPPSEQDATGAGQSAQPHAV